MKVGDMEFYALLDQFERDYSGIRLTRERNKDLWKSGNIYENGETNRLFIAYRTGYVFGKTIGGEV